MTKPFRMKIHKGVAALILLVSFAAGDEAHSRLVAIGDVHGAYSQFVSILERSGLVDGNLNWAGGEGTFVQVGDILDRGADSRKALDLMMKLEKQAPEQHGRVIPLLGNHEVMDMMGDLRYVSAGEYQAFSTDQSEKVREQAYQDYKKFLASHNAQPKKADEAAFREKWMAAHPLGFFELREAYGTHGEYGRWFRKHDAVAQIGDVVFLHGGLDPDYPFRSIAELNGHVHSELTAFDTLWQSLSEEKVIWRYMTLSEAIHHMQDEMQAIQSGTQVESPGAQENILKLLRSLSHWSIVSPDGPLWFRGLAESPEASLGGKLDGMLDRLKVAHIVVGHTVISTQGITPRFNSRVFLIDTGMNVDFFHGRASALEIQDGRFTALYANGEQQVLLGTAGSGATVSVGHAKEQP